MLAGEGGRRQHLIGRVDMHVILLGMHLKIVYAGRNRVIVVGDVDGIVNDIAWMRHPLAAYHPLVGSIVAEGIRHAAMPTTQPHTAANCIEQPFFLFSGNRAHRPDWHDQVERQHLLCV